jgi:hypothetical protein
MNVAGALGILPDNGSTDGSVSPQSMKIEERRQR